MTGSSLKARYFVSIGSKKNGKPYSASFSQGLRVGRTLIPATSRYGYQEYANVVIVTEWRSLKALSRSLLVVLKIVSLGDQLNTDPGFIRNVLTFAHEPLTPQIIHEEYRHVHARYQTAEESTRSTNDGIALLHNYSRPPGN